MILIPWFVVDIIGFVAGLFRYDAMVMATSGSWGAQRISFMKRSPDSLPIKRLKPRKKGDLSPIQEGEIRLYDTEGRLIYTRSATLVRNECVN